MHETRITLLSAKGGDKKKEGRLALLQATDILSRRTGLQLERHTKVTEVSRDKAVRAGGSVPIRP